MHSAVPGYVGVHRRHAVAKHDDAHDGGGNQQLGVDAEPREVQPNLLPKVLPAGRPEVRGLAGERGGGVNGRWPSTPGGVELSAA